MKNPNYSKLAQKMLIKCKFHPIQKSIGHHQPKIPVSVLLVKRGKCYRWVALKTFEYF